MAVIGCARVSTDGPDADAQQEELKSAGATTVFRGKVSGAVTERAALKRAVAAVRAGNVLLLTRLGRLARSTRDLLNTLDSVGKKGGRLPVPSRRLGRRLAV